VSAKIIICEAFTSPSLQNSYGKYEDKSHEKKGEDENGK
jgi:hypothetical protein